MNYYDSILFDFDGVLADTEPIHHACWREVLAPFGIDLDWETYRARCIGPSDWDVVVWLGSEHNPPLDPDKLYATRPEKQRIFAARMEADPPISSATVDLITSLSDYRLAVVSSSDASEIEQPLVASGIRDKLAALVTASDVREHKPHPEPYLLAARLLEAKRPLVVEDSATGIASATAAGFDVLRVENPAGMPAALRSWLEHMNNFR
jgi:HAD superfamily hydrolase (TIGR01509 family)